MRLMVLLTMMVFASTLTGCRSPQGTTPADKRASVMQMRDETLQQLYKSKPELRERVANAPGYGTFSNFGLKILLAGGGNGYGVVHNNKTGQDTYMRMGEVNVGLGVGAKDFRAVFIFNNPTTLQTFVDKGWEFGGEAEAGAKIGDKGAEAGASGSLRDVEIYQITKNGAMLQATVGGTKYWKDKELNAAP